MRVCTFIIIFMQVNFVHVVHFIVRASEEGKYVIYLIILRTILYIRARDLTA